MGKRGLHCGLTPMQRFENYCMPEPNTGCTIWIGSLSRGYGKFKVNKKRVIAHKWRWEQINGPVPDGLELDHKCRLMPCVDEHHLEPVTPEVNKSRSDTPWAINARKTHCPSGHPLSDDNLLKSKLAIGQRVCRTCDIERQRRWRMEDRKC
jgi:hypothetical protein